MISRDRSVEWALEKAAMFCKISRYVVDRLCPAVFTSKCVLMILIVVSATRCRSIQGMRLFKVYRVTRRTLGSF